MRKVFIDGGANTGQSIRDFYNNYPGAEEYEIHSFEAGQDPKILDPLMYTVEQHRDRVEGVEFYNKAMWTYDGTLTFFDKGTESSSVLYRDQFINNPNVIPKEVECVDISKWIKENFTKDDFIALKLDIEGAEYDVIKKMYDDGAIEYIDKFYIEIHGIKCGKTYKESLDLIRMVEDCGVPIYSWTADSYAHYGDRPYTEELLKSNFAKWYVRFIDRLMAPDTTGHLPEEIDPEKLKEIVTFMVENDKEYASVNRLGYSVRLTGRGLDIGPPQEEE